MLLSTAHADIELDKHSFFRADGEGGKVRLSLWNHPGDTMIRQVGTKSFEEGTQVLLDPDEDESASALDQG